ncbi:hypothetical protein FNV43_RR06149 [Rhamnella rubrinervis]|uniref:RING-type domain-containing protein n=1 Tax=Rhamnella rubrinervis TaxID=2594499 RepID=A0A8K0HD14_9ROSA|nr:hypothetical protein FNV43_RR06149 [Rhamnella rubrinervis]
MWNYMVSIFSHLKWACNFLLCYSFSVLPIYPCDVPKPTSYSTGELSVTRYHCESPDSADENVECAVCLSKIEEGQEIGELRCSHFFHKVCLHKWVAGFNRTTCPLCRGSLAAPPLAEPESGVEVLLIKPWSIRSDDDLRDTWWLR